MQESIKVSFQIQILRKEWHVLDDILKDRNLINQYFEEAVKSNNIFTCTCF